MPSTSCLPAYLAPCGNERQLGWLEYRWDLRGCASLRLTGRLSHAAIAALAGALRLSCISELYLDEVTWLDDAAPLAGALMRAGAPRLARLALPCLPSRAAVLNLTAACEAQRGLRTLTLGRCESSTAWSAAVATLTRCVVVHPSLVSAAADEAPAAFAAALSQARARRERLAAAAAKAGAVTVTAVRPAAGATQALSVAWAAQEANTTKRGAVREHSTRDALAPDETAESSPLPAQRTSGSSALLVVFGTLLAVAWIALLRAWRVRTRARALETSLAAPAKEAEAPEAQVAAATSTQARPAPPPRQHRPRFGTSGAAPAPHTPSPPRSAPPVASPCFLPSRHRKFVASAPGAAAATLAAAAALESGAAAAHMSGVTPTGSTGGSPEAPPSPPLAPAPPPRVRATPGAAQAAAAAARPALSRTPSFPPPPPRTSAPTFPTPTPPPPPPRTPSFPLPPHQTPTPTPAPAPAPTPASSRLVLPAAAAAAATAAAPPPDVRPVEPPATSRSALSPPPASPEPLDAQAAAAVPEAVPAHARTLTPCSSPRADGWLARLSGGNDATDDDTGAAADDGDSPCLSGSSRSTDSASPALTDPDVGVTAEADLPWAAWALPPTLASVMGAAEAATAADDAVAASAAEAAAVAAEAEAAATPEESTAASETPVAAHEGEGEAADRYFSMLWGSPSL